jgi:uncharacterized protein YcfJ
MIHRPLVLALILCGMAASASAAPPKQAQSPEIKQADARYAADKKLCAQSDSSSSRMQCLRDASDEHAKAIAAAKAVPAAKGAPMASAHHASACLDCAKVTEIIVSEKAGEGGAMGVIAGGVAGALLGNQIGGGKGKDIATIAGAAGGAFAGNKIEKKMNSVKVWTVHVQYDNGNKGSFTFDKDPGMKAGDSVKHAGASIVRH